MWLEIHASLANQKLTVLYAQLFCYLLCNFSQQARPQLRKRVACGHFSNICGWAPFSLLQKRRRQWLGTHQRFSCAKQQQLPAECSQASSAASEYRARQKRTHPGRRLQCRRREQVLKTQHQKLFQIRGWAPPPGCTSQTSQAPNCWKQSAKRRTKDFWTCQYQQQQAAASVWEYFHRLPQHEFEGDFKS